MKAHQLLADRSKWMQGWYAQTSEGIGCSFDSPSACKWCAMGAIGKCYPIADNAYEKARLRYQRVLDHRHPNMDLDEVNDELGYEAVMQVLREADV